MISAGATIIGTSSSVKIAQGYKKAKSKAHAAKRETHKAKRKTKK